MSEVKLLKARWLVDGSGSEPIYDAEVLVCGDRIERVARAGAFDVPSGAVVVDLGAVWLIPGLIDCHSHISMDGSLKHYRKRMSDPVPILTIRAVRNLEKDLMGGVTTVRCMGDKAFIDVYAEQAVASGMILGPSIVPSGLGIRTTAAHGYVATVFDGVEAVRKAVRDNVMAGAKIVKIFVTGDPRGAVESPFAMSPDEIRAAVDEAHRLGVPVGAHCTGGGALRACIDCGVDFIEHAFYVTDEDIELLARSACTVGFTINTCFNPARVANRYDGLVPEGELVKQEVIKQNWRKIISASVRYLVGTDAQHGELLFDLKFLVRELGVPPLQAIRNMTQEAARALGLGDQVGTLASGRKADIVGLTGQVLPELDESVDVCFVMKNGRILRR